VALLDQLRLLDRALRDVRVREALRTGDRGGRRLARFAGSVAPADLAVLRAVDARRFEAVAQRQAEMIRDRWWKDRYPGALAGTALAIGAGTREVALGALASPSFDRREGEDETGVALLGFILSREDRTQDPEWLADLLAYEYLVATGLPRRSKNKPVDQGLEQRLLPEGTRFLAPQARKPAKADLALARKLVVLPSEYPSDEIREALRAGQNVPELDARPHVVLFLLEEEAATELRAPALAHDLLDVLGQGSVAPDKILEAFSAEDKRDAYAALKALVEAGVVQGPLPAEPAPPPPPRRKGAKAATTEPSKEKGKEKAKGKAKPPEKPAAKAPAPGAKPAPKAKPAAKANPKAKPAATKKPAQQKKGKRK